MYQSYFSEGPHRLCHAAFTAVHIHQFSTVKSENSTNTGTGHAHALLHQRLSPWPLKLPATGSKLTSAVSKDVPAKDYEICEAFKAALDCSQVLHIGAFLLVTFKWTKAKRTKNYQLNFLEYLFFLLNKYEEREILPNCIFFVYKSAVSSSLFK